MLVKCKRNGALRYIVRVTNSICFEDDGKISGKRPSRYCYFDNYEPYFEKDTEKYIDLQK